MTVKLKLLGWIIALATAHGVAQQNQAAINVIVRDQTGAQIPGAAIEIQPSKVNVTTNKEGKTTLNLAPGDYSLVASFQGFVPSRKQIRVTASGNQVVDFALVVGSGGGVQLAPDPHQLVFILDHDTVAEICFNS